MESPDQNNYEASPAVQCPQCGSGCSVFDLRCPQCNNDLSVTTLIRRPRARDAEKDVPEIRFSGTEEKLWPGAIIGRAGLGRTILESDLTVSRRHLQVLKMEDRWFLQQLPDTRSACLFNGTPITQKEVVEITRGDHSLEFNSITMELTFAPLRRPAPHAPAPPAIQIPEAAGASGDDRSNFHTLAEGHLDYLVLALGHDGEILWSTRGFRTLFLKDSDGQQRQRFIDLVHEHEQAMITTALAQPPFESLEHRVRANDGNWKFLESSCTTCPQESGGAHLLLYCQDISARKDYELEIRRRGMQLLDQGKTLAQLSRSQEFQDGRVSLCFPLATEATCRAIAADRASVWIQRKSGGPLVCQDLFEQTTMEHRSGMAVSWHGMREIADECLLSGILALEEITGTRWNDLRTGEFIHERSRSILIAPIKWHDNLFGLVSFERFPPDQHSWTSEDQNFAASVADLIAIARERQDHLRTHQALRRSEDSLTLELKTAAGYVQAQLPPPLRTGGVHTEWAFLPCQHVGGDAFGYTWLDHDHFSFYLLDVVGHGASAAMLSVAVTSVLRNRWLKNIDYRDPAAVLHGLNAHFQMEHHANMYFTLWYGVFEKSTNQLHYSSAGHPGAILFARKSAHYQELGGKQLMIGADENPDYQTSSTPLKEGGRLLLFSDGVFEFTTTNGEEFNYTLFADWLQQGHQSNSAENIRNSLRRLAKGDVEDDFSLVIFDFNDLQSGTETHYESS
ncbi:MAG: serine phosphatase RsbU (regulator of sigma subunit) [Verrucomicrobiales bacterium]|jgi:serine phosphatase RsbU (regulator of sigma subunit)